MQIFFQICLCFTKIDGAPKFGHALYDPLAYETMKHEQLEYNNPPNLQVEIQDFDGTDDDFLENTDSEIETSAVLTPIREFLNEARIEYTSQSTNEFMSAPTNALTSQTTRTSISNELIQSTIEPTTTIQPSTLQAKQSSPLYNSILRQYIIEQTTTRISEVHKNDKPIGIARTSCSSCVVNKQINQRLALRQGGEQSSTTSSPGDSIKKSGYDYDDKQCKIINGRILCGYNKNHGEIRDDTVISDIDGDCRMRDDRIECGYVAGNKNTNILHLDNAQNLTGTSVNYLNREVNSTESEPLKPTLRGKSVILTNGVGSVDTFGYRTNDDNNSTEADLKVVYLKQNIPEVGSPQNELTLGNVEVTISTASKQKPIQMISHSNTKPKKLLINYHDQVNEAIGNFELKTMPEFSSSPGIFDEGTTVNESKTFVAEAQVQRRLDQGVELADTDGPAFNKIDNNYVQNTNSIKEENELHVEVTSEAPNYKQVTRCVEIEERIVCYNIQLRDVTPHM